MCVPVDVVKDGVREGCGAGDKDGGIGGKGGVVVRAALVLVLAVAVDCNVSALAGWWHGERGGETACRRSRHEPTA